MSEAPTADNTPREDAPEARLRRQAEALRRAGPLLARGGAGYSSWQKLVILVLMGTALLTSLILVVSGQLRRQVIGRLGEEWTRLYQSDRMAGIHKLPPPPPRRVEARVAVAVPVIATPPESGMVVREGAEEVGQPRIFAPPPKDARFEGAFQILMERSAAASRLADGRVDGLTYSEWRPLQARPPLYYVDLLARDSSDREVHYVWSVNLETSETKAESQAARDLEARGN